MLRLLHDKEATWKISDSSMKGWYIFYIKKRRQCIHGFLQYIDKVKCLHFMSPKFILGLLMGAILPLKQQENLHLSCSLPMAISVCVCVCVWISSLWLRLIFWFQEFGSCHLCVWVWLGDELIAMWVNRAFETAVVTTMTSVRVNRKPFCIV